MQKQRVKSKKESNAEAMARNFEAVARDIDAVDGTEQKVGAAKEVDPDSGKKLKIGRIKVDTIMIDDNVRSTIQEDESFRQLKASIEKVGLIQPLICRVVTVSNMPRLVLVAGHRRLQALKELEIEEAAVVVQDFSGEQRVLIQLAENMCRAELSVVDIADAMADLESEGTPRAELERIFERNPKYVARCLKVAGWPQDVKEYIRTNNLATRRVIAVASRNLTHEEVREEIIGQKGDSHKVDHKEIQEKLEAQIRASGYRLRGKIKVVGDVARCTVEIPIGK